MGQILAFQAIYNLQFINKWLITNRELRKNHWIVTEHSQSRAMLYTPFANLYLYSHTAYDKLTLSLVFPK